MYKQKGKLKAFLCVLEYLYGWFCKYLFNLLLDLLMPQNKYAQHMQLEKVFPWIWEQRQQSNPFQTWLVQTA